MDGNAILENSIHERTSSPPNSIFPKEMEIYILSLLPDFPPVGIHRKFNLITLCNRLSKLINIKIDVDKLDIYLKQLFDLEKWEENVKSIEEVEMEDFNLPEELPSYFPISCNSDEEYHEIEDVNTPKNIRNDYETNSFETIWSHAIQSPIPKLRKLDKNHEELLKRKFTSIPKELHPKKETSIESPQRKSGRRRALNMKPYESWTGSNART